ncbi:recombinase family protein [Enterococcus hermanniensis]|uniref:recombinase family protein n=1 Tax=Enterococcus hermanniensis TaxID=249189 RepID=UPI00090016B5
MENEKYKGDAPLQKSYTVYFLTKRKKKKEGERPQYFVGGHHEAIVSREVFDYVNSLDLTGRSTADVLARKIICGKCGSCYGPRTWHATSPKAKNYRYRTRVWQCASI